MVVTVTSLMNSWIPVAPLRVDEDIAMGDEFRVGLRVVTVVGIDRMGNNIIVRDPVLGGVEVGDELEKIERKESA